VKKYDLDDLLIAIICTALFFSALFSVLDFRSVESTRVSIVSQYETQIEDLKSDFEDQLQREKESSYVMGYSDGYNDGYDVGITPIDD